MKWKLDLIVNAFFKMLNQLGLQRKYLHCVVLARIMFE